MIREVKTKDIKSLLEGRQAFMILAIGTGCSLCTQVRTYLSDNQRRYPDTQFYLADVDKEPDLKLYFPIKNLPYLLYFNQGRFVRGLHLDQDWETKIKSILEPKKKVHQVKVFTTPTCPYCQMVKKYLSSKGVEFEEVDVSLDQTAAQQMVGRSGQMGVPQIWVDDEVVVGYDVNKLNRLLGL